MTGNASSEVPARSPHWFYVVCLGIVLGALSCLAAYTTYALWPRPVPMGEGTSPETTLFGATFSLDLEARYILLVMSAGVLGSFVHAATSFTGYVGNRQLRQSWLWWYLLRPFIGFSLALIFYVAVRAGFFTASDGAENVNVFGVVAIGALAGMFSKQATDKLKEMFDTLFKTAEPDNRADKLQEGS